jgi:adenylylsulfate kinase
MKSSNTVWHPSTISRSQRETLNHHKGSILWFTGLSGSGKSTLAQAVDERLHSIGVRSFVLDGDNVRHGLCGNLGFSVEDRKENIRRIGEASKLFLDAGLITLSAFISPFKEDRDKVRNLVPQGDFIEIYCKASLDICEERDVKGLYQKARSGLISDFTGISSPYETPENPELTIDTGTKSIDTCAELVIDYLKRNGVLSDSGTRNSRLNYIEGLTV